MPSTLLFVSSLAVMIMALLGLAKIAPRLGLLDMPDHRKHHPGPVPVIGGIALLFVLLLLIPISHDNSSGYLPILLASALIALCGAFDDLHRITIYARLIIQMLASLILVFAGKVLLLQLGVLIPGSATFTLGIAAPIVTLFAIMSVTNAFNFIDGADGLAGGLALIAVSGLWAIISLTGENTPPLIPILSGSLLAFMVFNSTWFSTKPARLFLGDAGSTLLGILLAMLMIQLSQTPGKPSIAPVTALWLLALPLMDFLAVIIRRIATRRSPFHSDREHVHHILCSSGLSTRALVALLHLYALLCAILGVTGHYLGWSEAVMFLGFVAQFALYYLVLNVLIKRRSVKNGIQY